MIEVPALPHFIPAVVSNSRGGFIVSKKLTKDNRIRVGIFNYDSDRLDDIMLNLFGTAFELSKSENWNNVFFGSNSAKLAAEYIGDQSGMSKAQPHVCLVPSAWNPDQIKKFFKVEDNNKYRKYCHIVSANVMFPVFCSRPDMVGMYTQFLGGGSGILLHNVRSGLAFCPDPGINVVC